MKKSVKKIIKKNKKPFIIAGIGAGVAALAVGLGKAFADMKKSAKSQHEVDKANFAAAKAEAKANWEEAKITPAQRQAKMQEEREAQISEANERKAAADARTQAAKKK